jgi:hypothetical protein
MELARDFTQYFNRFTRDLGADSVTGEYQYVELHSLVPA